MENFKQDFDIPNSESNTETDFSRQVEECQSNLHRIEKLFFDLQRDSQRAIKKSQDSLAKSFNCNQKKRSKSLDEQTQLQVLAKTHSRDVSCSNNNLNLKYDTLVSAEENLTENSNNSPLTFVVQVPSSIVDDFKKNLSSSDFLNFLSQCSSKESFKVKKKKGISSLFQNLFKRKKNNIPPSLEALLLKNMKHIKFSADSSPNDAKVYQSSNESHSNRTSVTQTDFSTETDTAVSLSNGNTSTQDNNAPDGQTLVFPINFNSSTNIHESVRPNIIIQHEIAPKRDVNQCTHTIKITNEPLSTCHSQSSSIDQKIVAEKVDNEDKEFKTPSLNKIQSENNLMKSFIENLLKSTENMNNLEILKIFVEILHDEKLKKKNSCRMDYCKTKISNGRESNFLHNFLQQLLVDLQNKAKHADKNIKQAPKNQSSKISICPSTGGVTSEEECFENPDVLKSKRWHKSLRRCQSPSMLKYRFCQSEKEFDRTENSYKRKEQLNRIL